MTELLDDLAPLHTEFDRQVEVFLAHGWPELTGTSAEQVRDSVGPLRTRLSDVGDATDVTGGGADAADRLPFLLVPGSSPPAEVGVTLLRLPQRTGAGQPGFTSMEPADLATFVPRTEAQRPDGPYLLLDVDPGTEFLNDPPATVLPVLLARGRTPLTIEEGLAFALQRPDLLRPNACFSLLGSRCGDRRVPALWISKRRPRLGWCWEGAPHTWLGSASAARRLS